MLQMERKNPAWYYKKINGTWTFQSTYASYSVYINDGFSFKNSIGNSKILFCAPYERSTQPHPFVPSIPNGGLYYIDTALSNSEFEKDKLVIYPNPVENLLQIQNTNTIQINKLQVYDAFGRNMISLDSTFENIDTRNLSSGIYLLEITFQNNTKKTVKFIKK
jgi:hypothetical protein